MRNVVLAVIGLALSCGIASATVPDPANCSVVPCDTYDGLITCPYEGTPPSAIEFTVNVRNADNDPIPNAFVEIWFGVPGNHCFCASVVLTGTTDGNGNVDFAIAAGGCTMAVGAAVVRANNVDIRTYGNSKSPDYTAVSDCQVGLADLSVFGGAYGGPGPDCHDYDNDNAVGLADFMIFGQCYGLGCTP